MNNNTMEYIETVSTDELRKVQLERIKKLWCMPIRIVGLPEKFDDAGVHPGTFSIWKIWQNFLLPLNRICVIIIRSACLPYLRKNCKGTCILRYNRTANGSRLYAK